MTTPALDADPLGHASMPAANNTLTLAAVSLPVLLSSGDTLGQTLNRLTPASANDGASVSQTNGTCTEQSKAEPSAMDEAPINGTNTEPNKAEPPAVGDGLTESVHTPSVEDHANSPIVPAPPNIDQDAVATTHNVDQDAVATTPPTEFLLPATSLKRRLERTKDLIVCPGVYDGFSARIALSVGFDALYMVSNARWQLCRPAFLT